MLRLHVQPCGGSHVLPEQVTLWQIMSLTGDGDLNVPRTTEGGNSQLLLAN